MSSEGVFCLQYFPKSHQGKGTVLYVFVVAKEKAHNIRSGSVASQTSQGAGVQTEDARKKASEGT